MTSNDEQTERGGELDHELLLAEVYEEVERRRSSGELPAELERELDRAFADLAPPGAGGDEGALLIERVERSAFIQPRIPLENLRPPVLLVKRILFKLMAWYVHFVTDQVTALGGAVAAALRGHHARLESLERGDVAAPASVRAELERLPGRPVPAPLVAALAGRLREAPGRVLVAEADDGSLLRQLCDAGLDAYGTEPRRARLPVALRDGLEVRHAGALDHLRQLPDQRLGAVVLVGIVDRSAASVQAELASQAARVVRRGGVVAVVSATPEAWSSAVDPVEADLAPGRPLRPATWTHLLAGAGLRVDPMVPAPSPEVLDRVDDDVAGAAQINQALSRLEPLLAPPPAYLLTGRQSS